MRELVGSKNTIGQMASVLKKLQKAKFTFFTFYYSDRRGGKAFPSLPVSRCAFNNY